MNNLADDLREKVNLLQRQLVEAEDLLWRIARSEDVPQGIKQQVLTYMKAARSLESIGINPPTLFLLREAGIYTVKDLCTRTEIDIRRINALGDIKLRAIRKQLKIHGLEFLK
jgi:DNA-directed RNA polymerase alpha subunit